MGVTVLPSGWWQPRATRRRPPPSTAGLSDRDVGQPKQDRINMVAPGPWHRSQPMAESADTGPSWSHRDRATVV